MRRTAGTRGRGLRALAAALPLLLLAPNAARPAGEAAGDTLVLDLAQALALARGGSPDAVRARFSEESARLGWRAAVVEYHPRIDLSMQTPTLYEALQEQLIYEPSTGQYEREWINTRDLRYLGDLSLTQPLPTGGQIRLESVFYQRFYRSDVLTATLEGAEEEVSQAWRLEFRQQVLADNQLKLAKERARLSYEGARAASTRSLRQLALRVVESYYSLVADERSIEIIEDDLAASREAAKLARRKYEAGLIPEVEALQLEVEVVQKETELTGALSNHAALLDRFRNLLGVQLDRELRLVEQPAFGTYEVDVDSAVRLALERRMDLLQADYDLKQADYDLRDAKRPWVPRAEVSAFYTLDKRDNNFSEALASRIGDYATNRGVALTLTLPLLSGGRRSTQVQQAMIGMRRRQFDREQLRKEVVLEVRQAVRDLEETRKRYQGTRRSLQIAETSYDMTRDRFENGQVTARVWIEAQLTLKRNRISALRALIDHTLAIARYKLAIGEDIASRPAG